MDWVSNLASVQQLQLPARIRQTALLITASSTELVQDVLSTAAVRTQLQATLCSAMLQSLQPDSVQYHSSRHTAPSTATQPSSAAVLVAHGQARTACINTVESDAEPDAAVADTTDTNMDHPQPQSAPSADAAPFTAVASADAWLTAGAALQVIYKWEDDQIVRDVIAFWGSLCNLLQGAWLQQPRNSATAPTNLHVVTSADVSNTTTDSNRSQQQQQAQQAQYVHWLLHLGHPTLSAVVALLHEFYSLTGISPLQHKQRMPMMHLLLLFLQVGGSSSSSSTVAAVAAVPVRQLLHAAQWPAVKQPALDSSSTYPGHSKVSFTAVTAGEALKPHEAFTAVLKLLQSASTCCPSAGRLQTTTPAAGGGETTRASTRSNSCSSASISQPHWQQLGTAAGLFLQAAYGWGPQGASSAAKCTPEETCSRPLDTPYDLYMMELLYHMLEGPCSGGSSSSSRPVPAAAAAAAGADGSGGCGGGIAPSEAASMSMKSKQIRRQLGAQEQQWEQWCSSAGFRALAELVVGYDKPQQLVSGLVALSMQQLQQQQQQQAKVQREPAFATGIYTEKHMIGKVMLLLEHTYLWQQEAVTSSSSDSNSSDGQLADPVRVRKLLLGCAELLRPAANCSFEWRCAALELMTSAVEQFMAAYTDDGLQCTKLWSANSLEGLCYCLNHDTSIKVRRTAMKLLQMVALPAGSPAALQLLQTLAIKTRDKDSHVAVSALRLLAQLGASVLCSSLPAEQFSGVVQAGLLLCSANSNALATATAATAAEQPREIDTGTQPHAAAAVPQLISSAGNKGTPRSSKAVLPAAAAAAATAAGSKQHSKDAVLLRASQKHFVQLLRDVLLCDVTAVQRTAQQVQEQGLQQWLVANAHRAVEVGECRLLLLLLLQDSRLTRVCEKLSRQVEAES